MPSYLDLALLLIVAVSALLSMVRGFTREVLAIASWAAAALAAYYLHPLVLPYVKPYLAKETVQQIAAVAIVFFITLVVVSIVTVKLSEAILDSKVGALDRTLGFLFGAARGFLLGVVAFLFFNWLVPAKSQPEWVASAKSRPLLQATGDELVALLPEDPENTFLKHFKSPKTPTGEDVPSDTDSNPVTPVKPDPAPEKHGEAPAPATGSKTGGLPPAAGPKTAGVTPTDQQKLDALLNKVGATPAAKSLAKKP